MQNDLSTLVRRFIEARDAIRAAFKMESEYIYPVCAQIFLAADRPVEAEQLERCKALVKSTTGPFSNFRGNVRLPLLCMLAAGDEPEARWERTQRCYALLKESFFSSQYLALAALLLGDGAKEEDLPALAARGKGLYQRMKQEHPFLTGQEDSVFALLLAESPRSDDALIEDMEACYTLLDQRFPKGDGLQTASHVLALSDDAPERKVERMLSLFDGIEAAGGKYGKDRQLPILAALSLSDGSEEALVADMLELNGLLSQEKGYKGVFGLDKRTRMMHAAMLLSLPDRQTDLVNAAAQQTTLAMIAAQQALMCAVVASSAASTATASSH
ncbi:MAG: DUF4003 family protein [Clostridia bacterium]|nr:DUF4003 family protein [Clostridia bacterium]